jgi:hypothetical protein
MKPLMLILCLMATGIVAEEEHTYRDFRDTQGRIIRGRAVAFDADRGIVTIELDDGRSTKTPVSVFCREDQAYFLEWKTCQDFLDKSKLQISASRKRNTNTELTFSTFNLEFTVEDTRYEIVLENKSQIDLSELEIEYCIFYEQEIIENNKQVCRQGVCHGTKQILKLASREKAILLTEAVTVFERELDYYWQYVDAVYGSYSDIENVQNGTIHGIWIRVHMKRASGLTQTREYVTPESIAKNQKWTGSSVPVGINNALPIAGPGYLPIPIRR